MTKQEHRAKVHAVKRLLQELVDDADAAHVDVIASLSEIGAEIIRLHQARAAAFVEPAKK